MTRDHTVSTLAAGTAEIIAAAAVATGLAAAKQRNLIRSHFGSSLKPLWLEIFSPSPVLERRFANGLP